jgi:hypothetical protein
MQHRVTDKVTESLSAGAPPWADPDAPRCDARTIGANGRTRTADRLFTKQLLYRLSYIGALATRPAIVA